MGAHGYWYRWTEVRGCDDTGAVQVRRGPGLAQQLPAGHAAAAADHRGRQPAAADVCARMPPPCAPYLPFFSCVSTCPCIDPVQLSRLHCAAAASFPSLPSGACLQWYEKWWEVSDWKGTKEMGAEKWGCNERGEHSGMQQAEAEHACSLSVHSWGDGRRKGCKREWRSWLPFLLLLPAVLPPSPATLS